MKDIRRPLIAAVTATLLFVAAHSWWHQHGQHHYLTYPPAQFAAQFTPPSAADSAATRAELDELLAMQAARTPVQVAAARADRKTRIERFYGALGIDGNSPPDLPRLQRLAERVEDDVRLYVRAAKDRFRRLRPYEIEPRLEPCIDDVRGDLSYPSGHAAFGYSMAYLLSMLVPERAPALEARADEFARQRMICGVHFRSDLEAGRRAARMLFETMSRSPRFREESAAAGAELRAALHLEQAQRSGHSSVRRAPPRLALEPATILPRCRAAIRATIASPRPNPPVSRLRLVSSRVNAWNTDARWVSGIPSPSSSTTSRQSPFSRATSMRTFRRA